MAVSILFLVVPVDIYSRRTKHTTEPFDSESKGKLLLNCFTAFLETFPAYQVLLEEARFWRGS